MNGFLLLAYKGVDWLGIPRDGAGEVANTSDQRQIISLIFFATSLILMLWLFARIQGRMNSPSKPYRPYGVFRRLLKHHGIVRGDRIMLCVLASCQRIKQPAVLLLSPALFAQHAEQWLTRSRVGTAWPGARKRLVRVAQRVFAEGGPATVPIADGQ
ncbi:MAG TPA: hypothetical protein VHP11_17340 [Tepidisphaeraceae bacterium]|nr:hypothetical protein [Tepidisphaeraceae bacterium]